MCCHSFFSCWSQPRLPEGRWCCPCELWAYRASALGLSVLQRLFSQGVQNGVEVHLVDELEALKLDPCAKTMHQALWSPKTASVDPRQVPLWASVCPVLYSTPHEDVPQNFVA